MRHHLAGAALRVARSLSFSALLLVAFAGRAPVAFGQTTHTWVGATDSNWATASNWDTNQVPATGDTVRINGNTANDPTNHNLVGVSLLSLIWDPSTNQFPLGGNPIMLQSGGSIATSNSLATPFAAQVVLAGPATITQAPGTGGFTFANAITGTGGVTIVNSSGSDVTFSVANSYTGPTTYSGSSFFRPLVDGAVPTGSALTLNGAAIFPSSSTFGSLAGSGTARLNPGATLTVGGDNSSTTFSGNVTPNGPLPGTAGLTKTGTGTLTLSGGNNYGGPTNVNGGRLDVNGSITSATTVNAGGTLGGTGTINNSVTVNGGGAMAPGGAGPGTLATGGLTMAAGSTFDLDLNGTTAGTQYDQAAVTGTVALGGATLSVSLGFVPTGGEVFTIIANDAVDAVVGTFAGLPEGSTLIANGKSLRVSYVGGDGNDVTLTALAYPTLAPASLPGGSVGSAYVRTVSASGGTPPYGTPTVAAGAVPPGTTFSAGTVSFNFIPVTAATFTFDLQITDSGGGSNVQSYTIVVLSPSSATASAGTPQSAAVSTSFGTALQVLISDAGSAPVQGAQVTFTAPGSGASGSFGGSNVVFTDVTGHATAPTFTANAIVGSYQVTTSIPGIASPPSFSLTNTAGAAASIVTSAGTPQSTTVNTAFATALKAIVRDASSNPVAGVSVTFAAPGAGASGTFAGSPTVTTNASGVATAPAFTANATSGSYTVTATASGVATPANFSLTNTPPPAVTTFSGPSPTGTGTISASFTGGGATCSFTTAQLIPVTGNPASPPDPAPAAFPHGLFDFTLGGCTPASTITMTIVYPATLVAGTQYWKYGPTPGPAAAHWYVMPATITGNTVVFTITDGGLGDDDLLANGTIVDQGGPGNPGPPGSATAIPTLSEWAMALMVLLLLGSGMVVHRRRY